MSTLRGDLVKQSLAQNRVSLRKDYFRFETPSMFYDLGYILADGNVYKDVLKLKCAREDEEIILGLRERLGSAHKIDRGQAVRKGTICYYTQIKIYAPSIVTDLFHLGVYPNKSNVGFELPTIPDEYFCHFVRGFFDGDGGVSSSKQLNPASIDSQKFYILGPHKFLGDLANRISIMCGTIIPTISLKKNLLWTMKWGSQEDLIKLRDFIYPEGTYPFLQRKRIKLDSFIKRV